MTYGEEIVGKFNSNGDPEIEAIKAKAAELLNLIKAKSVNDRRLEMASQHIEIGVAMGVKSTFQNT